VQILLGFGSLVISVANKCSNNNNSSEQKSRLSKAAASVVDQCQKSLGLGGSRFHFQKFRQQLLGGCVIAESVVTKR